MRFMVLIYANPRNWAHPMFLHEGTEFGESETASMLSQFRSLMDETRASGELKTAFALASPGDAKLISSKGGTLLSTDGPFAETKEFLAGTFIFECESLERAVQLAGRFPDVKFGTIEIRPIMEL